MIPEPDWPQRILVVHSRYRQRGGEDAVYDDEVAMLRRNGHQVGLFERANEDLIGRPMLGVAANTIWSLETQREFATALRTLRPDIVHAHNTFPSISPSVIWSAAAAGIPFVQTLHNFRLGCAQGMLQREDRACEDCVGRLLPLPALRNRCYQNSLPATGTVVAMQLVHRLLGTWRGHVSRFIALSEFSASRFVASGVPRSRIEIKPNFVVDPLEDTPMPSAQAREDVLLFVGRLVADKGIGLLVEALQRDPALRLRVAGHGPLGRMLRDLPGVEWLGSLSTEQVREHMLRARALVMPSVGHENFPRTLAEAFAAGLPVIASDLGALRELVRDGQTGWRVPPGEVDAWVAAMRAALADPARTAARGAAAREHYLANWTPERNYRRLIEIYQAARDTDLTRAGE